MTTNETNNLRMFDFNFLPSIEAALLRTDADTYQEFLNHPSSEIFEFVDSNNRFPKLVIDKLNRYVTF